MKKIIFLFFAIVLTCTTALAQKETATGAESDKDIDLLRRDLRAEKKQLIALNVHLTPEEATKFWPVYDQYAADMTKVYDEFYRIVKEYVAMQKTVSDADASKMMKRWAELQVQVAQTRLRYLPIIEKAIPPRKAAHFFHVDRRLYSLMDLQVVAQAPLIAQ